MAATRRLSALRWLLPAALLAAWALASSGRSPAPARGHLRMASPTNCKGVGRTVRATPSLPKRLPSVQASKRSGGTNPAAKIALASALVPLAAPAAQATELMTRVQDLFSEGSQKVGPVVNGVKGALWDPVANSLSNPVVGEVGVYLAKTVIAWGVPVGALGLTLALISAPKKDMDAGSMDGDGFSLNPFKAKKPGPKQYLKIERLDDKLESFDYSLTRATKGLKRATDELNRYNFARKFGQGTASRLSGDELEKVAKAEKKYQKEAETLQKRLSAIQKELRVLAAEAAPDAEGNTKGMMGDFGAKQKREDLLKKQAQLMEEIAKAEDKYIQEVSSKLNDEDRKKLAALLRQSDLSQGLKGVGVFDDTTSRVFVMDFPGDISASQVKGLRQEVTAVIRNANATRGDEAVLILNSGGGTVTGYGLAASQLVRLKQAGLNLTICVEQVAASGGYMMACCADRLVASPFAVLGSIGVISQQPNVYERLNREGVEFLTVTAGKFKRTLTPFKKPTDEDIKKSEEDLEAIWTLFKDFVQQQRPKLDVPAIATGETWFGKDALDRNLVDELKTADDVLLEKIDDGKEIYSVKYAEPDASPLATLLPAGSDALRQTAAKILFGDKAANALLEASQGTQNPATRTYMMDNKADETFFM
eukprot:CAMPEP_0167797890 /NCGR_PEP_ID=MMETSP0111_2-20121227/15950_1 /TAXON_ID=91324 /ORGANISM="Lotharella globosa, Strain CCCM811" /LENGTH=649 /DNA_ID=CAMNT_0007692135 /DNA_START=12 /DNA_END=1961 /DNA_ORIENTATION=+